MDEVYLIIECIQVVVWISLPLVARYLRHLEYGRKGFFLDLLSDGRMIIVPHFLSSNGKVFDVSL